MSVKSIKLLSLVRVDILSLGCTALSANVPWAAVANPVLSIPSKVSASTLRASTNALSTLASISVLALVVV